MAIRRRRKTLTNLLSTMERRVTAVELRPINLLPLSQAATENDDLTPGPDTVVGLDAPNQYKKVVGGYYYSSQITGVSKPRIELYFEADPGLQDDLTVRVSGIHNIVHSGNNVAITGSGDFRTINSDRPPYENRAVYSGQRDTPDEDTVDATVLYNPESGTQYGVKKEVVYRARISTLEATTTRAKIVFTSTNPFKVGDVIYVDIRSDEGPWFGIDGLHRVNSVGSNFITYDFSSPLEEPINVASVTDELYVHAVAQSAIRDGATWISSNNVVYVWKDIRWVLFSSSTTPKDQSRPNPVTDLEATDENDTPDGSANGLSKVTLTWTAPNENVDGSPLDDLVGYTVWARQLNQGEWEKYDFTGSQTTWSKSGFQQGKKAYFTVFARDSGGNLSEGVYLEYTTGISTPTVQKPAAPVATTYLGTIKITYDDLTAAGLVQAGTAKEIQVYFSDIDGFTPGPDSYYGKFPANAGSYIIIPGTEIEDNTDYYIKIIVRDIFGNITDPSDQVSIRARKSSIVTFDMIDVGSLTAQAIVGLQISTSETASTTGGIVLTEDFLAAYDEGGNQTFRIDASDGSVSIGSYLGRSEAEGFLTIASADLKFATIATANGIKIVADNAEDVANAAAGTAEGANEKISDITEVTAGGLRIKKAKTIQSLNIGSATLSNNTTKIDGGVIQAGTILANQIGDGDLPVGVIYAGTINASQVNAGILSGRTVRTAASGKRVILSNSENAIQFYNANGTLMGQIDGQTGSGGLLEISGPGTPGLTIGVGSTVFSGNVSATGTILSTQRVGQVAFSATGGTTSAVHRAASGSNIYLFGPASSDERLKKDIVELQNSLELINNLRPVKFRFKSEENGPVSYGLIAQEVQPFFDENDNVVNSYPVGEDDEDKEEYLSVEYNAFIAPLIGAIKELTQKNLDLEARIARLEESSE